MKAALGVELTIVEPGDSPDVLLVGVLTPKGVMRGRDPAFATLLNTSTALRIYRTGENTDHLAYPASELDLSFGVRCPPASTIPCARLPFWFVYSVDAETCTLHVKDGPNAEAWARRPLFASLISGHGGYPREELFDALSAIGNVTAPGRFIHNAPPIGPGDGAKARLLETSRFNICPENREGNGYVTEKLVQAHQAGAIPVYWRGEGRTVEHEVFSQKRILNLGLFENDIARLVDRVRLLEEDAEERKRFFSVPILKPGAQAHVTSVCAELVRKFAEGMERRGLGARLQSAIRKQTFRRES